MTSTFIGTSFGDAIHLIDRARSDQGPKHQAKPPAYETFANLLNPSITKDRALAFSESGLVQRISAPYEAHPARHATHSHTHDQNAAADASTAHTEGDVVAAPIQTARQNTETALHLASTAPRIKKPHAVVNCTSTSAEFDEVKASQRHPLSDSCEADSPHENAAPKPRSDAKTGDVLVLQKGSGVRVLIRTWAFDTAHAQRLRQHVEALLNAEGFTSASVSYFGPQNARPFRKRG